ncbi:MAG: restriction endonuclease subunit S [Clostridium beijerinckii]|nr:restriction endonuclease subunit S [Clostridium beijerinckii]
MEKNKENVPKIRFPGFEGPWEQRQLFDETQNIETGKSKFQAKESGKYEILGSTSVIGYDDDYDYEGDFLLTARVGANAGDLYRHSGKVKISDNTVFIQGKNIDFTYYLLMYFNIKKLAFGTGQPLVKASELKEQKIMFPSSLDERNVIGNFFVSIDNLITINQRKLEHLQDKKKVLLQKMFPKEGEKFPELRFPGFTDPWEQRKLSKIYKTIGNAFVGTATPYYVTDGHFYLESNNVKDGQINRNAEIFINEEFYQKQKDKWLNTGDMVMVQSGHVGHAAVIPEKLDNTAAHALIMFKNPKEKIEPYFLNYQYQTLKSKKKIKNITVGNTIKHILASDMQDFEVDIPKFEEQTKIATFFREIDNLITLHQRKLEHLKQQKKGLLQQMFI